MMQDAVHMPNADGSGMGSHLGFGMTASVRNVMVQETQDHMGNSFNTGMIGGH